MHRVANLQTPDPFAVGSTKGNPPPDRSRIIERCVEGSLSRWRGPSKCLPGCAIGLLCLQKTRGGNKFDEEFHSRLCEHVEDRTGMVQSRDGFPIGLGIFSTSGISNREP
jgi:hypothetical protein